MFSHKCYIYIYIYISHKCYIYIYINCTFSALISLSFFYLSTHLSIYLLCLCLCLCMPNFFATNRKRPKVYFYAGLTGLN